MRPDKAKLSLIASEWSRLTPGGPQPAPLTSALCQLINGTQMTDLASKIRGSCALGADEVLVLCRNRHVSKFHSKRNISHPLHELMDA